MADPNIIYADPAGNITAIVRGFVTDIEERKRISREILNSGLAEQVGFEAHPCMGGDGRLEMMGGEFCGNAVRAYGYLCTSERYDGGLYQISVEITGAEKPVLVQANLDEGTAYAHMPLPRNHTLVNVKEKSYPLVHMDGIDHMIVEQPMTHEEMVEFLPAALAAMKADQVDAAGVMFLEGDHLTPAVYVRDTDSLVWESSCGSGSVAAAWYQVTSMTDCREPSITRVFKEPGGILEVEIYLHEGKISSCTMGGMVSFHQV